MKPFVKLLIDLMCISILIILVLSYKQNTIPVNPLQDSGKTYTVNAGADQTIYLSQTSTVMLDGSGSSGGTYAWTKIYDVQPQQAGYPTDPATITSPSSATTTVTGLIQGAWYYQLAVTNGSNTKYDTTVVRVDYDVPPVGATYIRGLPLTNQKLIDSTNSRYDTTHDIEGEVTISEGNIFFNRGRLPEMMIDSSRGKFYSTVEDGYGWHGSGGSGTYARVELHLQGSTWNKGIGIDTNKTYCFEWKGYFPQDFSYLKSNQTAVVIMQMHANDGNSPPFSFTILDGHDGRNTHVGTTGVKALYFTVTDATEQSNFYYICNLSDMVNTTHTIRLTIREGKVYTGQDAFVKVELDCVQKFYNNTSEIGRTWQQDYPKIATLYDYGNALVDPNNHTRGRKFSLVTESFKIYEIK